jgi:hypothetical protein
MRTFIRLGLLCVAITLAGCQNGALQKFEHIYDVAVTTTVPARDVRVAADTFDILKGTVANFAVFCVSNHFTPLGCDVATRRKISMAIKSGAKVRSAIRGSLATNQPVLSTVYNVLISAIDAIQATPAATFTGG